MPSWSPVASSREPDPLSNVPGASQPVLFGNTVWYTPACSVCMFTVESRMVEPAGGFYGISERLSGTDDPRVG